MKINPITGMDYPDPDVIRVGNVYYMISTTMYFFPGGVILQSYDLMHWEIATYLFDQIDGSLAERMQEGANIYGRGMWAASLRYHKGMFYVAFVSQGTEGTHLYLSRDIKGPWEHRLMDEYYHDCSLLFEEDRVFIVSGNTNIRLVELSEDLTTKKEGGIDQIIIRDDRDAVNLGYEGAHFYKINGRYYITLIHWPKYNQKRTEAVFVSDHVEGPYVGRDVFSDDCGSGAGIAQGGLVDTEDGRYFAILFQDSGAIGRVPYLVPVTIEEDGWLTFGNGGVLPETFALAVDQDSHSYEPLYTSDDFGYDARNPKLKLPWQWNHVPEERMWWIEDHALHIQTERICINPILAGNTLTQRMGLYSSATVTIDGSGLQDGDYAGLLALQGCYCMIGLCREQGQYYLFLLERTEIEHPWQIGYTDTAAGECVYKEPIDGTSIRVALEGDFRARKDLVRTFVCKEEMHEIGSSHQMRFGLDHFTGARYGLCMFSTKQSGGVAAFTEFRYEMKE